MEHNTHRLGASIFLWFLSTWPRNVTAQIIPADTNIVLEVGGIPEDFLNTRNPIYSKLNNYIKNISKRNADNKASSQFLLHFQISNLV